MAPVRLTLPELLGAARPAQWVVGFAEDGQPSSQAQWLGAVASVREQLTRAGVRRVALFEPDGLRFAALLLGAWSAGVQVTLPGDSLAATREALAAQVEGFMGASAGAGAARQLEISPAAEAGEPLRWTPAPETVVLRVLTSGTTGTPVLVEKTLHQLDAEVAALEVALGADAGVDSAVLSTASHQHFYGLLFKILWPLTSGRPFFSPSIFLPEQLLGTAARHPRRALVATPAHLKRLPSTLPWASVQSGWTAVFSSGGKLEEEAVTRAQELLGRAPLDIYGSTETGGLGFRRCVNAQVPWRPFPGVSVRVADDGVLWAAGLHLPDPSGTRTADLASLQADGTFVLRGRADRVVKVEAKRVSLSAVEAALTQTGLVSLARVLKLESTRDELAAVVVASASGAALPPAQLLERLKDAAARTVERLAVPRRFRVVRELPTDAMGKTSEQSLRALFGALPTRKLPDVLASKTQAAERATELRLRLNEDLEVFAGHFPGLPVLPGVAQLDWARYFAARELEVRGPFLGMEQVKFRQILRPEQTVDLHLRYEASTSKLTFRYERDAAPISSGVLLLGEHVV